MISEETIHKILEAGIRAPSGENSQPWLFKTEGERVWLFNRPEADQSLYNYHQNGSLVSHGALLENMSIAAEFFGFRLNIQLFPDPTNESLVAALDFVDLTPGTGREATVEKLFDSISKRVTNRKPYDGKPLSENEKKELLAVTNQLASSMGNVNRDHDSAVRLVLIEDREKIAKLAKAASVNETMLVLNKNVHDFFFSHVRWTSEENEIQPNGFYVDTLELNPQQAKGFKMLRSWRTARILAKLGVAKTVGRDNEEAYKTSSAMVGVIVKDSSPRNLVLAGHVLERAWLTATKLGLSVQPCTGALFLAEGIQKENRERFSESQRTDILSAKKTIYETLGVVEGKEHIAVMFRVGRGEPASAQAARFPLKAFLRDSFLSKERRFANVLVDRKTAIEDILKDLMALRENPAFANHYAVEENIRFFKAIRSYPRYVKWIIRRAPKLDRARLLELTDLPFPRWDRAMHEKLVEMESREFPGLVAPLVNRLVELVKEKKSGLFIGLHLGSGGREVDRQVIKKLIGEKFSRQVVLVGVDKSSTANELAKENFGQLEPFIAMYEVEKLTKAKLDAIMAKETRRHIIILAKNDIFSLPQDFPRGSFDVVYHTLFKHHLTEAQKNKLDAEIAPLGKKLLEYDGLKSWPFLIGPHTWSSWQNPPLMNGSIFSNLRYVTKEEIKKLAQKQGGRLHVSKIATYLLEREF